MNEALESQTQAAHLKIIASFSLLSLAIHLLTNRAYAYFRDELYFIAARQTGVTSISRPWVRSSCELR
jgi:hypothetical protein